MPQKYIVGFGIGVVVGAGGCYFYISRQKSQDQPGSTNATVIRSHPALKYGIPQTEVLREYDGFLTAYDFRTRNPKWVLEKISPTGEAQRANSDFFEDKGVDQRFRTKMSDFQGSGYDRGHMAPAAAHRGSQEEMDQTFSLANISPQVGKGFNRDYWARFEGFVKQLTKHASDVYVITGPLWLPTQDRDGSWQASYKCIGSPPGLVSVPTHFYKVILADGAKPGAGGREDQSAKTGVGAFVMPNAPIDPKTPLSSFVVPLEDLESVAGTSFFPAYLGPGRRKALDTAAVGWRAHGLASLTSFERISLTEARTALPAPALPAGGESFASKDAKQPRAPKTSGGQGAMHLCEFSGNACRLPAQDWYLRGAAGGAA